MSEICAYLEIAISLYLFLRISAIQNPLSEERKDMVIYKGTHRLYNEQELDVTLLRQLQLNAQRLVAKKLFFTFLSSTIHNVPTMATLSKNLHLLLMQISLRFA